VRDLVLDPPTEEAVAANTTRFSWEANAAELVEFWRGLAA
jgi:hypothetical protein